MKPKKLTFNQARKINKEKAMPEVKKLVKKYGRTIVQGCLNSLREYEQKINRLNEVKKEVAKLEKELS